MHSYLIKIWNRAWSQPDPLLMEAGVRGELLVAKTRLGLAGVLLLIPLAGIFVGEIFKENLVGLGATASVFLISLIACLLIRDGQRRKWLGFVTSGFDVTLVSATLASFFLLGQPHTAVNSKVVFEGYFLALSATTLRYDKRVCVVTGLLALAEYSAIVVVAGTHWDLNSPAYAPYPYGMFSWGAQISRLILLLTASLLTLAVVSRTQQFLHLSTSDPLTSLFNRGYFNERVSVEVGRAIRYRQPLTIAMVDVDHFKSFNDQHGHVTGDKVLQSIAAKLHHSFRQSDIVARYGGEEFVIAMPQTDATDAFRKLEDLRRAIAGTPIPVPKGGKPVFVTISAGLARFPNDGEKEDDLIAVADARLFQAKRNGRNQIVAGNSS